MIGTKMKIDAHQHFWEYSVEDYGWINEDMYLLRKDLLPQNLKPILDDNQFDGTIAVQARQSLVETQWLLKLADENEFIKGVVGWVDLRSNKLDEQLSEFSKHPKFVGVRHVVQDEPDDNFLLRPNFLTGIEKLAKYNLTYDILIFEKHLPVACEFVKHFPEQPFVIDHIAKPLIKKGDLEPWAENIRKLAEFPNVWCKVSGMVTEADWEDWTSRTFFPYLDVVFDAFGANRIMFGSDWPVCLLAATYAEVVAILKDYLDLKDFTDAEQAAILGENTRRFYQV